MYGLGQRLIGDFYFAAIYVHWIYLSKWLNCCRHLSMMTGRPTMIGPSMEEEHFREKHWRCFLCKKNRRQRWTDCIQLALCVQHACNTCWIVICHHKYFSSLWCGLSNAKVLCFHPHHLREVTGIHIRVQQPNIFEIVVSSNRAIPIWSYFLTYQ